MSQIDYTAYHEHKAQDIAKQVFGGKKLIESLQPTSTKGSQTVGIFQRITNYFDKILGNVSETGKTAYVRIAEPLYSYAKKSTVGYNGFIIYPFEEKIQLLGNNDELKNQYYQKIIDTFGDSLKNKNIYDMHAWNISYKYDNDGALIFTIFDLGIWADLKQVHELYTHTPRPPKSPRQTQT